MSTDPSNTNDGASNVEPYVRAAHPSELDALVTLCRRSFIDDPVMNYAGDVPSNQVRSLYLYQLPSLVWCKAKMMSQTPFFVL